MDVRAPQTGHVLQADDVSARYSRPCGSQLFHPEPSIVGSTGTSTTPVVQSVLLTPLSLDQPCRRVLRKLGTTMTSITTFLREYSDLPILSLATLQVTSTYRSHSIASGR